MIPDKLNMFSEAQDTILGSSIASTNSLDLGENAGAGEELHVVAIVDADFVAGTSLSISLRSDTVVDMGGTPVTHWTGEVIDLADLVEGYAFNLPTVPPEHGRYVDLYYTVVGVFTTGGKITAGIVHTKQTNKREAPVAAAQAVSGKDSSSNRQPVKVAGKKIGRNDPCPCGSGKKYKKCCGR